MENIIFKHKRYLCFNSKQCFFYTAFGTSMTLSAFSYALNSYFTTKRGRAISLAMTLIGVGPIIVPQVTTLLSSYYGSQVFLNTLYSTKGNYILILLYIFGYIYLHIV